MNIIPVGLEVNKHFTLCTLQHVPDLFPSAGEVVIWAYRNPVGPYHTTHGCGAIMSFGVPVFSISKNSIPPVRGGINFGTTLANFIPSNHIWLVYSTWSADMGLDMGGAVW
jgi:hypothetical protein